MPAFRAQVPNVWHRSTCVGVLRCRCQPSGSGVPLAMAAQSHLSQQWRVMVSRHDLCREFATAS